MKRRCCPAFQIILTLALLALPATSHAQGLPGSDLPIRPENLKFTYQTHDGQIVTRCTHQLKDAAARNWEVTCGDPAKHQDKYLVHLWVTRYQRPVAPKMSVEILYWVTDWSQPNKPQGSSTTTWIHLKEPSELHSIQMSQSLENDTAALYLELAW